MYADGFDVQIKDDNSPVTAADLAANQVIELGLRQLTPDLPILSEESAQVGWEQRRHWGAYWLVDPLDGTREFVKRNGEFSVNIALIYQGAPAFGVVLAPVTGIVWHAMRGELAYRRQGLHDTVLRTRTPATAPLRVAASRSHRSPETEALLARMGRIETIAQGSSLKFCRIAEGGLMSIRGSARPLNGIPPPASACCMRRVARCCRPRPASRSVTTAAKRC